METNQATPQPEYGPADYERLYLPKLEAQSQEAIAYVTQMQAGWNKTRPVTMQEIMQMLDYLQAADQNFQTYEPWAAYLEQAGLPQMAVRLGQIRADVKSAFGIYAQMYKSAGDFQNRIYQIQAEANTATTQTILDVTRHREAVMNRCHQMHDLVLYRGYPMHVADLITRLGD